MTVRAAPPKMLPKVMLHVARALVALLLAVALWVWVHRARVTDASKRAGMAQT